MKHIKPAVLPFFLLLAGLILTALLIMNRDLRTRTACAVAGRGMLSLVQQTMEEPPRVALTFDDGPNSKYTPMLLEGLRKRNILATFFLVGENIEGNEEILLEMQKDGHLIGNHTWDHVQLDKISREKALQEIQQPHLRSHWRLSILYPPSLRCLAERYGTALHHAACILGYRYPGLEKPQHRQHPVHCPFPGS